MKFRIALLLLLALSACRPAFAPPDPTASAPLPAAVPSEAPAVEAASPAPALETPAELTLSHLDPSRIVPAPFDPAQDFPAALAAYRQISLQDPRPMQWFSGTMDGTFDLHLVLDLSAAPRTTAILRTPIQIDIAATEAYPRGMNLLRPAFSGGGGVTNEFPPFSVQAGSLKLMPETEGATGLSSGAQNAVLYHMHGTCLQPGVFNVTYRIPYETAGVEKMAVYSMMLACPETVTAWTFNPDDGSLVSKQSYQFQNGAYVALP